MKQKELDLNDAEREILQRSKDAAITRRRIRQVIFFASLYAALLVVAGWILKSWVMLLVVSLLYVLITTFEKVAYGRAVLLYKSVIRKLSSRVDELEKEDLVS